MRKVWDKRKPVDISSRTSVFSTGSLVPSILLVNAIRRPSERLSFRQSGFFSRSSQFPSRRRPSPIFPYISDWSSASRENPDDDLFASTVVSRDRFLTPTYMTNIHYTRFFYATYKFLKGFAEHETQEALEFTISCAFSRRRAIQRFRTRSTDRSTGDESERFFLFFFFLVFFRFFFHVYTRLCIMCV